MANTSEASFEEAVNAARLSGETHGCLAIGVVYILFYLSGVMLFWMLGSAAHRYTRNYEQLSNANTLEEVRDALVVTFGSVNLTPPDISEKLAPLRQSYLDIKAGADAVSDAAQKVQSAATDLDAAASKSQNAPQ